MLSVGRVTLGAYGALGRQSALHPTGSRALDALLGGGYPAGSIIELSSQDPALSGTVAWMAVAAALRRGRGAAVCSNNREFDELGKRLPLLRATDDSMSTPHAYASKLLQQQLQRNAAVVRLLQPDALTRALRALQPACPLMLLQSAEAVAEAAGGSGQQRARSLSRFLLRMSGLLAEPPGVSSHGRAGGTRGQRRPRAGASPRGATGVAGPRRSISATGVVKGEAEGVEGLGDTPDGVVESGQDGGNGGGGGYGGIPAPASSLLVCSQVDVEGSGQDNKYSMLLRQYATVRLVLAHAGEPGAAGGRGHSFPGVLPVVAELRKCPWLSTRSPTRNARIYVPVPRAAPTWRPKSMEADERGWAALDALDLVCAGVHLGLVTVRHGDREIAEGGNGLDGLEYEGCAGDTCESLVHRLESSGMIARLRTEVDFALYDTPGLAI